MGKKKKKKGLKNDPVTIIEKGERFFSKRELSSGQEGI